MRRYKLRDQNGITLVEIIIVIAIVGILASTSVMMIGHLHYANTQKVVSALDSSLDKMQVTNMSKTGRYTMYVYKLSDGYYCRILADKTFDVSQLSSDGTKLCNNSITIKGCSGNPVVEKEVGDSGYMIKISYTKAALFDTAVTNVDSISIDGVPKYSLKLVKDTGKHFVKQ